MTGVVCICVFRATPVTEQGAKILVFMQALAIRAHAKIPSLELLSSLVGVSASSQEFKDVLKDYHFAENTKRDNERDKSWGTGGVFFVKLRSGRIQVGMRPPSDATNMPVYPGELPKRLKAGDSIDNILKKLGAPLSTAHDPDAYYVMNFAGITVITMGGKLFEVWLLPSETDKAE
ncbi:MAG: hypothetical protein D3915_02930 [Candidatus Electrothrix sp. AU1_5]|nr:hypothetical protein [Candidatus Electrothrix gigas]MCI5192071.1 hypothetical protein [Candidatus Electrothrix gigas]